MKVTIDLPLTVSDFDAYMRRIWRRAGRVVEAEIVDVAPHLAHVASFAAHPASECGGWQISNIETGCSLCGLGLDSREAALRHARDRLRNRTPKETEAAMAAAIKP